ncbi:MAG: DUF3592 domain-containing protein [Pseudomonadota bacterium]
MVGLFALICGFILLGIWGYQLRDWWMSARWTKIPAIVRGTVIEPGKHSPSLRPWAEEQGYRPVVRYAYAVDGQTYLGARFGAISEPFETTEGQAETFLQRFPIGGRLQARVDPSDPTKSLLSRDMTLDDALPGYLGLGCILVGFLFL